MNIGFINPPSEFLTDQRVFISLGILRVATQLKNENVKFLDLSNEKDYNSLIYNFIKENSLNIICLTATTPHIEIVFKFAKFIKENFNIKIILGGPHITLMYSSLQHGTPDIKKICKKHIKNLLKYIDTLVIGDGEFAIHKAIHTNEKVINAEEDETLFVSKNYDDVAIANRDFLDVNSYHYFIDGKKSTNIISQIGCPYQCGFCSGRDSKSFNHIRKRSIPNIIKEIDILHKKYGYEGFMFYDDEINLNKIYFENFLLELIKYQKDNKVEFNLRAFTRSNLLSKYQAELMYKAGFRWLLVGFESGSDRILKNMNKGCTVQDNSKCFEIARESNLKIKALMSIGHPGESHKTIKESINWLKLVKPDETDITIVSIYPGSYYFDKAIAINKNLLKYTNPETNDFLLIQNIDFLNQSNFYKSKSNEYASYVSTETLSPDQIVKERLLMEKEIKKLNLVETNVLASI
jgi:radical SAM superfamily enzyme YgiQ (UPF0313 family)